MVVLCIEIGGWVFAFLLLLLKGPWMDKYKTAAASMVICLIITVLVSASLDNALSENWAAAAILILVTFPLGGMLYRRVYRKTKYKEVSGKNIALAVLIIALLAFPLRKSEFPLFSYQFRAFFIACIGYCLIALVEELTFRYIPLRLLVDDWNPSDLLSSGVSWQQVAAIFISSLCFTLLHFDFQLKALVSRFIFGIFLSGIFMLTDNFWLLVLIHALNNLLT